MNYYCTYCKKEFSDPDVFVLHSGPNCRLGANTSIPPSETPTVSANEKPSERAARVLDSTYDVMIKGSAYDYEIKGDAAEVKDVAAIIARETSCDTIQKTLDDCMEVYCHMRNRHEQEPKEDCVCPPCNVHRKMRVIQTSLAEENQRLRGVLERIKVQAEALERNPVIRVFAQEVYHRMTESIVKDSLKIAVEALKK